MTILSPPSCYIQLVKLLLSESPSEVLFLVLNYGDLLERAHANFSPSQFSFKSMDDYIRKERPAKVVKLHGSTIWFMPIGPQQRNWHNLVKDLDLSQRTTDDELQVSHSTSQSLNLNINNKCVYPVLTAPLARENVSDMVCHQPHIEFARTLHKYCSRFMVIGSSGLDDDLLELLGDSIQAPHPSMQFVAGDHKVSHEVWERFSFSNFIFRNPYTKQEDNPFFNGGFKQYTDDGAALEFLQLHR